MYENRVTGERAVVLRGDEDGAGESGLVHLTVKPGGAVVGEHVHPVIQERFRVIDGVLGTKVDGVERRLEPGVEVTVPAGMRHDWWNAGASEASVLVELSPPEPRFETLIATLFGLANAGRTNAKGMPIPSSWHSSVASSAMSSGSRSRQRRCRRCSSRSWALRGRSAGIAPPIPST